MGDRGTDQEGDEMSKVWFAEKIKADMDTWREIASDTSFEN